MENTTHTTLSPKTVAALGLSLVTTFSPQQSNAILNLPCVPGFVMFPEPYKKSTDDCTGFPKGSLLMRYDGQLFVVDLLFIKGDKWYSLVAVTKSGYKGHTDSPSRHWVHENYLMVGQEVAK